MDVQVRIAFDILGKYLVDVFEEISYLLRRLLFHYVFELLKYSPTFLGHIGCNVFKFLLVNQ